MWDYFGLDLPDLEKYFNVIKDAKMIFAPWFTLQYLRGYIEDYESLKRSEGLVERCEEEYRGDFYYVKIDSNPDIWCLQYPEEIKDTIYCD